MARPKSKEEVLNNKLPIQMNAINRVPEIVNQSTLLVNEDESLTIQFMHLTVVDQDNNYPEEFTLTISSGSNYTFSNATVQTVRVLLLE